MMKTKLRLRVRKEHSVGRVLTWDLGISGSLPHSAIDFLCERGPVPYDRFSEELCTQHNEVFYLSAFMGGEFF